MSGRLYQTAVYTLLSRLNDIVNLYFIRRSSAVAQRPCDASRLYLVTCSFNSTIPRVLLLVTSASAIKFCSVQPSRQVLKTTLRLAVINKVHRLLMTLQTSMPKPDIGREWESRFLPTPVAFDAPIREGGVVPLEYFGKTRTVWLSDSEKLLKICLLVSTEYTNMMDRMQGCRGDWILIPIPIPYPYPCESPYPRQPWRNDRQTETAWRHRTRSCTASHGRNNTKGVWNLHVTCLTMWCLLHRSVLMHQTTAGKIETGWEEHGKEVRDTGMASVV